MPSAWTRAWRRAFAHRRRPHDSADDNLAAAVNSLDHPHQPHATIWQTMYRRLTRNRACRRTLHRASRRAWFHRHLALSIVLNVLSFAALWPGLALPILTIRINLGGGGGDGDDNPDNSPFELMHATRSIMGTVHSLFQQGAVLASFLILLFSIWLPLFKASLLLFVQLHNVCSACSLHARSTLDGALRHRLLAVLRDGSKWSMADVFVTAIFVAFLSSRGSTTMRTTLEPGFYWFLAYCLLSLCAVQVLQAQLPWYDADGLPTWSSSAADHAESDESDESDENEDDDASSDDGGDAASRRPHRGRRGAVARSARVAPDRDVGEEIELCQQRLHLEESQQQRREDDDDLSEIDDQTSGDSSGARRARSQRRRSTTTRTNSSSQTTGTTTPPLADTLTFQPSFVISSWDDSVDSLVFESMLDEAAAAEQAAAEDDEQIGHGGRASR